MHQPDKKKVRHLSKFSQLILLSDEAHIISSCDSIFTTKELENIAVTTWFPFLESIFDYLMQLTLKSPEVKFSKIETPISQLPGIYDFNFSKILIDEQELLLWTIYDYTNLYEDFKNYQQRKNEYEILREILEMRHKNLRSLEDINTEQNIVLEDFDHIQLHYFNNLKSALQSPVNALDGFTFLLSGSLHKSRISYLEALKNSISDIQRIIEDLEDLREFKKAPGFYSKQPVSVDPKKLVTQVVFWVKEKSLTPLSIKIDLSKDIPPAIFCNELILSQILFGLINNILRVHPTSHLHIGVKAVNIKKSSVRLRFQITEYLGREHINLPKADMNTFVLSFSVLKQLIDLHKGNIAVEKDPKSMEISITCDLEFTF